MSIQAIDNNVQIFLKQIEEDIQLLIENLLKYDSNLNKDEYAFNYWVLSKLYNVDEECITDNITEYNDKAIDCYVHFEDSKELYIIQNKYYGIEKNIITEHLSDFLTRPIATLIKGNYKNKELQRIFNTAIEDSEYKIFFHFYTTSNCNKADFMNILDKFNKYDRNLYKCFIEAKYFNIIDTKNIYYGETFKNTKDFKFNFKTPTRGTFAAVREEYGIGLRPAFYIITPISEIYRLFKKAQEDEYQIFSNNIREWLGDSPINKGIIETLNSENKKDFLYYNNGITMIYESAETDRPEETKRIIPLINPQIVNGCQTTNSIYQALNIYSDEEIKSKFDDVYIMVKALQKDRNTDDDFYNNVMKFTNKQNSIPEKAFASKDDYFGRIQKELLSRGFLLEVKPSDKAKNKSIYTKKNLVNILEKANKRAANFDIPFTKLADISIPLEKLLQIALAFVYDGYAAYTKKCCVLKPGHTIYKEFSLRLLDMLTLDSVLNIYLLHQKAEIDKNQNGNGRNPIPYYLVGFLGDYFKEYEDINIKTEHLNKIFENKESIDNIYEWLKDITTNYREDYLAENSTDYNKMIKQKISIELLRRIKENIIKYGHKSDPIYNILSN